MKNILVLIKNNLKISILKKPVGFIISLIAPVIILFIMLKIINFNSGYIKIGIIDNDKSITSDLILSSIKSYDGFDVKEIKKEDIKNLFAENAINTVIEIDSGFEDDLIKGNTNLIKVTSIENNDISKVIKELINEKMANINNILIASEGNKDIYYKSLNNYSDRPYIEIQKESLNDLQGDYTFSQIFVGFIIMFMLIRGMASSYRVFDEKEENIYTRIFMAPIKTYEYYVADVISGYISILIQVIFGVLGIRFLNIEVGVGNFELFIILALLGLVSISLGVCCRAFSKNRTEASNIFNFANMIMVMIGGAFVPIDIMPPIIEKISYFTPVRWAMESIVSIQQGATIADIYKYLAIILLFALTFFTIGIYRTSKEEKVIMIN
ncbi:MULTISPECIES: ABC transporter permease [Clostridium]|uniref:ABC transporter permease n=1 Tax=Clostridium TaxID=1485 RepID=UPI00189AB9C2|nr:MULTISPECIES: ABC transporter permease [Clostridium]MCR1950912.1 ABC transporter permease [Clostridium sp. DSM 100503]MDI9216481.1 ABC transporter permease [Clostridium tertium]